MILETKRLKLREFELSDAGFILELLKSAGWLEFIGNKNVNSLDDARKYIEDRTMKSYREHGFGLSMVELKPQATPIGMCGLVKRDTLDDVDIGFAMLPEFTGKGYGYEIASATLDYARNELGLKRIVAITVGYNKASIALLEKVGLKYEQTINIPNDDEELLLFGVNFED